MKYSGNYRISTKKLKKAQKEGVLTGEVRHSFQLLLPELCDLDGLGLGAVGAGAHALLVGVGHDLGEVLRVEGVEDVEKVVSRRPLALWVSGREVPHELCVLGELGPEIPHRELVVPGHLDGGHLGLPQQELLPGQHFLEEVLVDH